MGAFCALAITGLAIVAGKSWFERREDLVPAFPGTPKIGAGNGQDAALHNAASLQHGQAAGSDAEKRGEFNPIRAQGRVVDDKSTPVSGAEVTFTCVDEELQRPGYSWLNSSYKPRAVSTFTDSAGAYAVADCTCKAGQHSHILWVVLQGYKCGLALIDGGQLAVPDIVLAAHSGHGVRVIREGGEPVAGARVQLALIKLNDVPEGLSQLEKAACRALRLEWESEATGALPHRIPAVPGRFAISAQKGEEVSAPYLSGADEHVDPIELKLSALVQVGGVVRSEIGTLDLSKSIVQVYSEEPSMYRLLDQASVQEDGAWIADDVPDAPRLGLLFRLLGDGIAADQCYLARPNRGASYYAELVARPEVLLPVRVVDRNKLPIPNAYVLAEWSADPTAIPLSARTNARGEVEIKGGTQGSVRITVEAIGFTKLQVGPLELELPVEEPIELVLSRGYGLTGIVTHKGDPQPSFEVVWWTPAAQEGAGSTSVEFNDRIDGTFELAGLPEGTVYLLACSARLPRSPTVRVELTAGRACEVLLNLPEALRAHGQVVDAVTEEPIAGAVVQLYANNGTNYVTAWGEGTSTDTQGRFEIVGFAEGQNRYTIEAPGFASLLGDSWANAPGPIELGQLPLFGAQKLTVVLMGSRPKDLTGFSASAIASRFYDPKPFSSDGVATFEDMGPGRARVFVSMPDGSSTWHMVDLLPGEEWVLEVPIEDGPALEVEVTPEGTSALPERLSAAATALLPNGYHGRTSPVGADGKARIPGVPVGEVAVDIWNADGERIAAALGDQGPRGGRVVVPLAGREQTFLVTDRDGTPVHNAEVHLYLSGGRAGWFDYGYSDEQGLYSARGFPSDELLAGIIHPDHGKIFGLPVDLASAADPLVLTFESDATLSVRLLESGKPRSGVQVRVLGGSGTYIVGWVTSDASGLVRVPQIGAGTYDVTVLHPGYWQHSTAIASSKDSEPVALEIYRLATLRAKVKSSGGAPVAGLVVDVRHAQLGSAAQWLASGQIEVEGGALATHTDGSLTLEGVPRGDYVWSVELSDGTQLEGAVAVAANQLGEIEIRVP